MRVYLQPENVYITQLRWVMAWRWSGAKPSSKPTIFGTDRCPQQWHWEIIPYRLNTLGPTQTGCHIVDERQHFQILFLVLNLQYDLNFTEIYSRGSIPLVSEPGLQMFKWLEQPFRFLLKTTSHLLVFLVQDDQLMSLESWVPRAWVDIVQNGVGYLVKFVNLVVVLETGR